MCRAMPSNVNLGQKYVLVRNKDRVYKFVYVCTFAMLCAAMSAYAMHMFRVLLMCRAMPSNVNLGQAYVYGLQK